MPNDWSNKQRILGLTQISPTGGTGQVRDISSDYWFGPLQPVNPAAPKDYKPRQFAYDPGANIIWQPKADSGVSFEVLRALADSWDLLRMVIETRKDQLCGAEGEIRVKQQPGEKNKDRKERQLADPVVKNLNDFFKKPDGFHPFKKWMRMWVEDMLTIDAVSLYYERDKSGKIARIMPLAGETINRIMTDQGITPPPPSVAYQQVVYGTIAAEFTTNDMFYSMRNERTWRRYGYSRVEQILITISIGLRRQEFQLQYYTSGNVPEALCFLPSELPIDRIKEIQGWFDSLFSGDLANRRRLTFLPGFGGDEKSGKPSVLFPKEVLLKDAMDDWLAQIVCYCFGVSPHALLKQVNRATAQAQQESSEEEGLAPDKREVETVMNQILGDMGLGDKYEWAYKETRDTDVLKQAQADNLLVGKVYTINEIREKRGEDPIELPEADMLGMFSPQNGFIPLEGSADAVSDQRDLAANPPAPVIAAAPPKAGAEEDGAPPAKPASKPKSKPKSPAKVVKRASPRHRTRRRAGKCRVHIGYPRTFCSACQQGAQR